MVIKITVPGAHIIVLPSPAEINNRKPVDASKLFWTNRHDSTKLTAVTETGI